MGTQTIKDYTEFVKDNCTPVFSQPWFLDIVTQKQWDVVLSYNKDQIVGAWPFFHSKKYGFNGISMPPHTPFLGPIIFNNQSDSQYKRNSFTHKICKDLEKQLPSFQYLNVKFNPGTLSWYPFFQLDYRQTTRYTYIIEPKQSEAELKANLKKQVRNVVCKDEHKTHIRHSSDVDQFLLLVERTFRENGISRFFDKETMGQFINTSLTRKQ